MKHRTLTTLRDKLIKIGAKVVHHACRVVFQMAEVADPPQAVRGDSAEGRTITLTGPGIHMTSTRVENLEFDTDQRRRSAQVRPKLSPMIGSPPQTGQEAGPV